MQKILTKVSTQYKNVYCSSNNVDIHLLDNTYISYNTLIKA